MSFIDFLCFIVVLWEKTELTSQKTSIDIRQGCLNLKILCRKYIYQYVKLLLLVLYYLYNNIYIITTSDMQSIYHQSIVTGSNLENILFNNHAKPQSEYGRIKKSHFYRRFGSWKIQHDITQRNKCSVIKILKLVLNIWKGFQHI